MDQARFECIRKERAAFDKQLHKLLKKHEGEFVVFREGKPVAFYATAIEAHDAALARFGLDTPFLLTEVAPPSPLPASLSWEYGLLPVPAETA